MAQDPAIGRPHGRPASRRDVAALAGVAPGTVSLVLNGTPGIRVSAATRKRIEDAARALAYQSNQTANALATGRTDAIGVVLNYVQQPFQDYVSGLMDGLWETLAPRGLRLVLASGTPEHRAAGLFHRRSVDGIVFIAPPAEADPELDSIAAARFPAVCIGSRPSHPGLACVDIDNAGAGRQATNALIDAGHRRILHLAGPLSVNTSARERLAGYRSALATAGIPEDPALIHDCSYNGIFASDAIARILDQGTRFTAIFAANSDMGRGAVTTLVRRGLRIPTDVSVISIDQDYHAGWHGPELTCLAQPLREIGQVAGQRILGMIAGSEPSSGSRLLPCRLVVGASMAPPSNSR
ncbi:MAG: LacI family DNA-binding transcriptional regulator [Planctomycetes bacterium]|nr:LacI family DNA-binding transcriptional regulator [Planctomycetota bacterium]